MQSEQQFQIVDVAIVMFVFESHMGVLLNVKVKILFAH